MEKEEKIAGRIAIQTLTTIALVSFGEILFFEYVPERHHWLLRLINGESHKLRMKTTSRMLLEMSSDFIQVNQNCIINLSHLCCVENQTLKCLFHPPYSEIIPVMSKRYYAGFKGLLTFL